MGKRAVSLKAFYESGKRKAEGGERKAENGKRKAESGKRRAEGGRRRTEKRKTAGFGDPALHIFSDPMTQ